MRGTAIRALMAGAALCALSARVAEASPGLAAQIPAMQAGAGFSALHPVSLTGDASDPSANGEEGASGDAGEGDDGAAGDDGAGDDGASDVGAGDDGSSDDGGWTGDGRENCDNCRGDDSGTTDDGEGATGDDGTVWAGGTPDFCESCSGTELDDGVMQTMSPTSTLGTGGPAASGTTGGRGTGLPGTRFGRGAAVPDCGAVAGGARCGER